VHDILAAKGIQITKTVAPAPEMKKAVEVKAEAPKVEAKVEKKVEAPKQEAPKQEAPKQEAPKQEAPKAEAKVEVAAAPKAEATKTVSVTHSAPVMTKQVQVSCRVVSLVWGGGQTRAGQVLGWSRLVV
jgi:outer membrane biosynthesis protein TonB